MNLSPALRPVAIAVILASLVLINAGSPAVAHPEAAGPSAAARATTTATPQVPAFEHVLVVVMENHSEEQIIGNPEAPYINRLADHGAFFSRSSAVAHPSEPNYVALFSGSTHGLTDDSCPHTYRAENLGHQLIEAHHSFAGYSEDLPAQGSTVCSSGGYARKHNPWIDFADLAHTTNKTFAQFPARLGKLPTVSFVIPNLCHDIHDCGVATGDTWVKQNLGRYVTWAETHHSLFVLTFDEDDYSSTANHITTIFAGQDVVQGSYHERITHYSVLRTIEAAYGLPGIGAAATARPITNVWAPPTS